MKYDANIAPLSPISKNRESEFGFCLYFPAWSGEWTERPSLNDHLLSVLDVDALLRRLATELPAVESVPTISRMVNGQ